MDRPRGKETGRHTEKDREFGRQTDREIEWQIDRSKYTQIKRHSDAKQIKTKKIRHIKIYLIFWKL